MGNKKALEFKMKIETTTLIIIIFLAVSLGIIAGFLLLILQVIAGKRLLMV
jgi:hypothetical protein